MAETAPSIALLQYAFERAGVHPDVGLVVERVERRGPAVEAHVVLRYRAARPICCAEPGCYIPALRSDGLEAIRKQVLAEELLDELNLKVVVTLSLESGFRFREPGLGAPDGTQFTYEHPES